MVLEIKDEEKIYQNPAPEIIVEEKTPWCSGAAPPGATGPSMAPHQPSCRSGLFGQSKAVGVEPVCSV